MAAIAELQANLNARLLGIQKSILQLSRNLSDSVKTIIEKLDGIIERLDKYFSIIVQLIQKIPAEVIDRVVERIE